MGSDLYMVGRMGWAEAEYVTEQVASLRAQVASQAAENVRLKARIASLEELVPDTERDPGAGYVGFEDEHLDELDVPVPYRPVALPVVPKCVFCEHRKTMTHEEFFGHGSPRAG